MKFMSQTLYDFSVNDNANNSVSLEKYRGKTLLIVNTASKCGFTPQYKGLQELYEEYSSKGFEVLGFPCNQFGSQEPGTEEEISEFCSINYNITFPIFSKIDVKGPSAEPLFRFLTSSKPGLLGTEKIKWNFTKFLIDQNGQTVKRYSPQTTPEQISSDVKDLLEGTN